MQYFDDDDVLGMYRLTGNKFDLSKPIVKKFEVLHLLDWAVYKLEISKWYKSGFVVVWASNII